MYTVTLHPLDCLEELIIDYKAQLPFTYIVFQILCPAFWFVFSINVCVGNLVRDCILLWGLFTCLILVTLYPCFRNSKSGWVFFETLLLFIKLVLIIIFPVKELLYVKVKFFLCLLEWSVCSCLTQLILFDGTGVFTLLSKVQLHVSALDNSHLQVVHESLESS